MLNLGESADRVLPERALALAADRTSGSMTLGERVHGLFEQLHVPVFRYLLRKTRDSGRAEDITQETFLRLFRHLRDDRLLDNPKAWISRWPTILPSTPAEVRVILRIWMKLTGKTLKNRGRAFRRTPRSSSCNASVWI